MKKLLFSLLTLFTMANVHAQGRFEVLPLKNAKLHVYYSNDVMADASYIVEGKDGLVTIETPLFKAGLAEFNSYIGKLGKKALRRSSADCGIRTHSTWRKPYSAYQLAD